MPGVVAEEHPMSEPHVIKATVNYYLDPSKGGYDSFYFGTVGEKRRPFAYVEVDINDMRGREQEFNLDVEGFQYVRRESALSAEDSEIEAKIKEVYYPECAELVEKATGASRVHVMGHVCRRKTWDDFKDTTKDLSDLCRMPAGTTARYVHVDYSYTGSQTRLEFYFPSEASSLSKRRWAIINIWRPVSIVTRENLALCDARSVPDSALRAVQAKFLLPTSTENLSAATRAAYSRSDVETWSVAPPSSPSEHIWHYCSKMTPDEALLIKIYDSNTNPVVARRSPHTSFVCAEDHGKARESIEVRTLVFWDE